MWKVAVVYAASLVHNGCFQMPEDSMQAAADEPRAFVAVKVGERSWVTDLPRRNVVVGSGPSAAMRLESADVSARHIALHWDGALLTLRALDEDAPTFLNGKPLDGSVELKPGDEIAIGSAQLVVGVAVPPSAAGRRALTHHEFRDRLYEEMARARRAGRPTALIMVHARPGAGAKVSAAALDSFRAGDVVGTYAPNEVELLLPDTPAETARHVVERVLADAELPDAVVGYAEGPLHGDHPELLMRAARDALALAHRSGESFGLPPPEMRVLPVLESDDPAVQALVDRVRQLAQGADSVLVTGEFGCGKGAVARLVHDEGGDGDRPFVTVACVLLARQDLGEGTTASDYVAKAAGGTLFLSEVGELPLEAQEQLLAALEGVADVRLVASTHRALAGLVERNAFDAALYERLSDALVEMPPLRGRPDDLIPLARQFAEDAGAPGVPISPGALARIRSYPWPGNVLELYNSMERAVRLSGASEILAEHLPSDVLPSGEGRLREQVDSMERDAIVKALADANHNQTHAAKRLGVSRRALIYKMEKYGLKPPPGSVRR